MNHMFEALRSLKLVIPWIYNMPEMRNVSREDALLAIQLRMYNRNTSIISG